MKELGLVCRVRMKKYRSYKGEKGTTADNILDREFRAEKPNQKWVTDVTEFRLFGQKLYLSPILDLCSGDIVTYTMSDSPNLLMVTTMLEQAFAKIPDDTKLLLHSDQGWHYRHKQYVQMLQDKGIRQSMSHKGNCYDNAVMENFFGHLKSELLYLQEFKSMEHFKEGGLFHFKTFPTFPPLNIHTKSYAGQNRVTERKTMLSSRKASAFRKTVKGEILYEEQ